MTDYKNLIRAMRYCAEYDCCNDCPMFETCDGNPSTVMGIAADSFEKLLITRTSELNGAYRQGYDAAMIGLVG